MLEHKPPYTNIGSDGAGWMTLCDHCFDRVKPFFSEEKMRAVQKLNHTLMEKLQERFDDGSAAQEEHLLASTFSHFNRVDLVETVRNVEFRDAGDEGQCLFATFEPPRGNSKEEIRARAIADRMTAAYKDLLGRNKPAQDLDL